MTLLVVLLIVFSLGLAIGDTNGYDRGVRDTETGQMLRLAFHRPLLRGRDATWRRP